MENNEALKLDDTLEEELEEIHVDVPKLISLITSLCKSLNKAAAISVATEHIISIPRKGKERKHQTQSLILLLMYSLASKAVIKV